MKNIITNIQEKLSHIEGLKYIDENWGQLDYYSPNFPVQWPCVLIDIIDARFDNIGRDNKQVPVNRQMGAVIVDLRIADLRLSNTSMQAPRLQKAYTRSIWDLIQEVHERLHGWSPDAKVSKLIRETTNRVLRDDGVQEYAVRMSCEISDC